MSLNVFLVFCILGVTFMIYALFQWTCGDKRSAHGRQLPAHKDALMNRSPRPFLVSSQKPIIDPKDHPEAIVCRLLENREREWKSRAQ